MKEVISIESVIQWHRGAESFLNVRKILHAGCSFCKGDKRNGNTFCKQVGFTSGDIVDSEMGDLMEY